MAASMKPPAQHKMPAFFFSFFFFPEVQTTPAADSKDVIGHLNHMLTA